jgi:hypothetical protein
MDDGILENVSSDPTPRAGDIRFAETGEIEVFDGHDWGPIRQLPSGGPSVFRAGPIPGETAATRADTEETSTSGDGS